jgi:Bacteriophage lambda head decoration protein D
MFTNRNPFFNAGLILFSLLILSVALLATFEQPAVLVFLTVLVCAAVCNRKIRTRLIFGLGGTVYSEPNYLSDVVLDEEDDFQESRDAVIVASGQKLAIGAVLGKITIGEVSEDHAGNTGDGAMTLDETTPALANCQVGDYAVKCIAAATDSGTFEVFDPKGYSLGTVAVAATFANQIKFSIADGATDFVVGDTFTVTVAAGTGKVKALAPAALDGTQDAYGVLVTAGGVDASATGTNADTPAVAIVREAILKDSGLVWPAGITDAQKAAALDQLAAKQVQVRKAIDGTAILT